MLQIKKIGYFTQVSYNLQFLFRSKKWNKKFLIKKQQSTVVTLRAPKHFNIGKYRTISLNFKLLNLRDNKLKHAPVALIVHQPKNVFRVLSKFSETSSFVLPNSIKYTLQTKFILSGWNFSINCNY